MAATVLALGPGQPEDEEAVVVQVEDAGDPRAGRAASVRSRRGCWRCARAGRRPGVTVSGPPRLTCHRSPVIDDTAGSKPSVVAVIVVFTISDGRAGGPERADHVGRDVPLSGGYRAPR